MTTLHGEFVTLGTRGDSYPTVIATGPFAVFDETVTTEVTGEGEEITVPAFGEYASGHLRAAPDDVAVDVYRDGDLGIRVYPGVPEAIPVRTGQKLTFKAVA